MQTLLKEEVCLLKVVKKKFRIKKALLTENPQLTENHKSGRYYV